jgi:glycosyltransferase involved in cell wall biosynthesis
MKISYGLTVCNEHIEIKNLINYIIELATGEYEIVVVYDQNRVTEEVLSVLDAYKDQISSYPFDFQQNFLENKNFMNSKCTGDYIFQLDADEIPNEMLIQHLPSILKSNNGIDLIMTPRKNIVTGLTQEYVDKWHWHVNDAGWVNWPDVQKRIYKNHPDIQWSGHQVHGMVSGFKTYAILPLEEAFSITHNKTIDRQSQQNDLYDQIEKLGRTKYKINL